MDLPRKQKGRDQDFRRNLMAALILVAVVLGMALVPAAVVWFVGGGGGAVVGGGAQAGDPQAASPAGGSAQARPVAAWGRDRPKDELFESVGATLAGDLDLPDGPAPHPAVAVVHGSGRMTRQPLKRVSRALVPRGFAVLTYDKRGVGRSSGIYTGVGTHNSETVLEQLARDAAAAVDHLARHPSVDSSRVGLLGFSQAGWIIPLAASFTSNASFAVILSGPTVSVGEEIYYSQLTGEGSGRRPSLGDREIRRKLRQYDGPRGFDPRPVLESLDIPILWILGGRDRSIQVPECVEILDELIKRSGKPYQYRLYPQANHGLRDPSGRRIQYWDEIERWVGSLQD